MSSSPTDPGRRDAFEDRPFSDLASDPQFRIIVDQVAAEKKAALEEPGPSWREWGLHSALKWYVGLGFLIVDGLLVDFWTGQAVYLGLLSLIPAVYAEYLLWQVPLAPAGGSPPGPPEAATVPVDPPRSVRALDPRS